MTGIPVTVRQYVSTTTVPAPLRANLVEHWVAVTNAGGAAGFPFPPVTSAEVTPSLHRIVDELHPARCRLFVASAGVNVVGWAVLRRNVEPLVAHRGTLHHVQSHPEQRGRGVGSALLTTIREVARDEVGLCQLHLEARAGLGLETFYERQGWREIGRWPGGLRFGEDCDRDEILMVLKPL